MSDLHERMLALAALWEKQAASYEGQANRMSDAVLVAPCHVTASVTVTMCAQELRKVLDGLPVEMLEKEGAEA